MKKIISILLVILLMLSFCSCDLLNGNSSTPNDASTSNDATNDVLVKVEEQIEDVDFVKAETNTLEDSDSTTGKRYIFSLYELTDMLNEAFISMGDEEHLFDYTNWQDLGGELFDDNEVEYNTYYYKTESVTYTAAVETVSQKVMNVGVGCSYAMFQEKDKDYQYSVMVMASLLSCICGGYNIDDMGFFYSLFSEAASYTNGIYYDNQVFYVNVDQVESTESSVLFLVGAADESIVSKWELTDYVELKSK